MNHFRANSVIHESWRNRVDFECIGVGATQAIQVIKYNWVLQLLFSHTGWKPVYRLIRANTSLAVGRSFLISGKVTLDGPTDGWWEGPADLYLKIQSRAEDDNEKPFFSCAQMFNGWRYLHLFHVLLGQQTTISCSIQGDSVRISVCPSVQSSNGLYPQLSLWGRSQCRWADGQTDICTDYSCILQDIASASSSPLPCTHAKQKRNKKPGQGIRCPSIASRRLVLH